MRHEKQPDRLIAVARSLRRRMTFPERLLWHRLKPSVNKVFDIRRQHPVIGNYVVDFFFPDLQIAFEIDGKYIHGEQQEQDASRQRRIEESGVAFVRIPARWVLKNPGEVAQFILSICSGEIALEDLDESFL